MGNQKIQVTPVCAEVYKYRDETVIQGLTQSMCYSYVLVPGSFQNSVITGNTRCKIAGNLKYL